MPHRLVCFIFASVALAIASVLWSGAHPAQAGISDGFEARYQPDLHCTGDQTTITIRLTDPQTGRPSPGVRLLLSSSGVFVRPGNTRIEGSLWVTTDHRGIARVRVEPVDDEDNGWVVLVHGVPGDVPPRALKGTCDFDGDPSNNIRGTVFEDANSNGLQDDGERPVRGKLVSIQRGGLHWFYILPHWQRTDAHGGFNYTGVPLDFPPYHPISDEWMFCIDDAYAIVFASVNGMAPNGIWDNGECFTFFIPPGDNVLSVGATRVR